MIINEDYQEIKQSEKTKVAQLPIFYKNGKQPQISSAYREKSENAHKLHILVASHFMTWFF